MTDPASILWRAQMAVKFDDDDDLQQSLAAITATIVAEPGASLHHHIRGRILALMGKLPDAAQAHASAIQLDPQNAQALYSLGLLYGKSHNATDALRCFEAAAIADAKHLNAWYNAGQAAYNLGQFEKALVAWTHLAQVNPNDFHALEKVIQAQRALNRHPKAAVLTQQLRVLQTQSEDPAIQDLHEVIIDQLIVGQERVLVSEAVRIRDLAIHNQWTFAVQNRPISVQLESSAYGRDNGVPYVLAVTSGGQHRTIGPTFATKPSYPEVKQLALAALLEALDES